MDVRLDGKRILVTGASRGIGRAIALRMAESGATVAAVYNRAGDAARTLGEELARFDNGSHVAQADVSDEGSVDALMAGLHDRWSHLDVLVNNAGVVSHQMLATMELAEWRRILDTNLTGIFLVTRRAIAAMPEGGSVINVTSAVALRGMPGRTHYASSKAGVIGFTRALCKEVGSRDIRVNAIAPGIIETDQVSGLTPEGRARYASLAALNRLGVADDVAGVALFLASDLSRFVSGQTINVDGGI